MSRPHHNGSTKASTNRDHSESGGVVPFAQASRDGYRVGPGNPPKEYQFKKGQSGNPLGSRLKKRSIVPDLKGILQCALKEKLPKAKGEKMLTKAEAGIRHLVDQFARGDRNARRDLMQIADRLGVNLAAGDALKDSIAVALTQNDQELVDDFIEDYLAERSAQRLRTS
jgi:hypothetical protein